MQVTFTSNYGADLGLTMQGRIIINDVELSAEDVRDIQRYFSDVAHYTNVYSDIMDHEIYIDVAQHATFTAINEAVDMLKDHISAYA